MDERPEPVVVERATPERAAWQRPMLRKLDARNAENGAGAIFDLITFS